MRIKQFIDNQWSEYADYDNRRSLPHIIDGLKITQRKVMFTALATPKNARPEKVSQFASRAAAKTAYHHGEASMMDTVTKLAQDFPGTNNIPLLERHGQFGSRLSAEASSPRYIHTKIHNNWGRLFKEIDQEIVVPLYDDNEAEIEPKYYIPIVPLILLNGGDGVGNGFSSLILTYDLKDVVKGLKEIIKTGKVKTPLVPYVNGFTGKIHKVDRQVVLTGALKIVNTTKIIVTELPPKYTNDKYKAVLNKLIDKELIKDYKNHSTEDKWEWIIECPRGTTALGEEALIEKLGLIERVTETFVGWGIDDSVPLTFDGPEQLLEYWHAERIKLYQASLTNQISVVKKDIIKMDTKIKFLKWCLTNDFRKMTRAELIAKISSEIKKMTPEWAAEFVGTPIYKITKDEIEKAELDMESSFDKLDELAKLNPVIMMEADLTKV
jgi:Type IIA topoisomerase (DNA gyrase/topo II, topoisomerase IV), A subunit